MNTLVFGAEASTPEIPPPPVVEVQIVASTPIRVWSRFSGKLAAVEQAEIKPLVGGQIQKVYFKEGDLVSKGAPLFLIDPRPFEAKVKRIEAQLVSAESAHELAKQELARTRGLLNKKLISESTYDAAKSNFEITLASISEAKNALVEAKLDVEYAKITAPFDGRISRAEMTIGNVVEVNTGAPVLATLVSEKQVYAEFNIDEHRYIKAVRASQKVNEMPVELKLAGDDVIYQGHLYSFDNQLNSSTGTIRARAIFDNKDGVLKPGMFANIRLGTADEASLKTIPQRAIGTNQARKFVYVINDENMVTYREVSLGQQIEQQRVVVSGLEVGEQVVVNGIAKIRPNMPVTINQVTAEPLQTQE